MLRHDSLGAALALSLLLLGCQTTDMGTKETVGTLGGAAAGGLVGSQIGKGSGKLVAVGAGVLLGGWLGNEVGSSLDKADRAEAVRAERRAYGAPMGQQVTWNNPQSGHSGTITPMRDGYANDGAYCREFQQTIMVGGKQQQGYGRACQQADGSWKIVQ